MTATRSEIATRVDALAEAHQGDDFVAAVERLADEVGPQGRPLLQQVLLERAADEQDFQEAIRTRSAQKGWTRRTLARLEGLLKDDRADALAAALEAGPDGEEALAREVESLRSDRGRAAVVLDELSRHKDPRVRGWVPGAAADLLGDGASRLILSLTRDREPAIRADAVAALLSLGPESTRLALPDLRRRLHARDESERIRAIRALAEAGDATALPAIEKRAAAAKLPAERQAAVEAAAILKAEAR